MPPIRECVRVANAADTTRIKWTPAADKALSYLKTALLERAFLVFPKYDLISREMPFDIFSDSNAIAGGFILVQMVIDKKTSAKTSKTMMKPMILNCGSKAWGQAEQRHHINRKELKIAILAREKCLRILAHQPCRLNFDSKNIGFYEKKAERRLTPVWTRLACALNAYPDQQKRFVRGIYNLQADLFTRFTNSVIDAKAPDQTTLELFPDLCSQARDNKITTIDLASISLLNLWNSTEDQPLFNQATINLANINSNPKHTPDDG